MGLADQFKLKMRGIRLIAGDDLVNLNQHSNVNID
jgi:hypothetical protein